MISSADLALDGESCAKDWVSVDCGTLMHSRCGELYERYGKKKSEPKLSDIPSYVPAI